MTWVLLAVAVLVVPAPGVGGWAWRRFGHRLRPAPSGDAGIAWVLAVAGELRAGSDGPRALRVCHERHGVAPHAARAAAVGGDVATALARDAVRTPVLRPVAAAWGIAHQTGAGLAGVLDNIADGHRRSAAVQRDLAVELAGPRATARLMSLLPLIGVGLAILLGADPVGWLTSSVAGIACLVVGLALNGLGFWWMNQIVRKVEADL